MKYKLRKDLLCTEVGAEVIVYDPVSNQAHNLNDMAAAVFQRCRNQLELDEDDPAVFTALSAFEEKGFFDDSVPKLTRREALVGVARAAVLPVVMSVMLPTPAAAQSSGVTEVDCENSGGTACGQLCIGPFPFGTRACASVSGVAGGLCGCVATPGVRGCT